jgi:hypothetical protein
MKASSKRRKTPITSVNSTIVAPTSESAFSAERLFLRRLTQEENLSRRMAPAFRKLYRVWNGNFILIRSSIAQ